MARTHEQKKKQYLIKAIQRHRSNLQDFYQEAEVVTGGPGLEVRGAGPGLAVQGREDLNTVSATGVPKQQQASDGKLDSLQASTR